MGSICSNSNHNKVSSSQAKPILAENKSILNDIPEKTSEIQKNDSKPLAHFFDLMDKDNKPKDPPLDGERVTVPIKPEEKTFLSTPFTPSVLKGLNGQPILKITETGRVVNFLGETLGFFKDHCIYVSSAGLTLGRYDEESKVRNNLGSLLGYFSENGVVFDAFSVIKGKIEEESGAFRDKKFMLIGNAEGEFKNLGIVYYFFFPKK